VYLSALRIFADDARAVRGVEPEAPLGHGAAVNNDDALALGFDAQTS